MDATRIEDQLEITRVIQLVARAYDHKRHDELLPQVFDRNAKQHYYIMGAFIDMSMPHGITVVKEFHDRCYATQHVVSPPVIEFDGDTASATSAVHAVHIQMRDDGTRNAWLLGGYYSDVLIRRPEGWRIRERVAKGTYESGSFLTTGVRLFPTLPTYETVE